MALVCKGVLREWRDMPCLLQHPSAVSNLGARAPWLDLSRGFPIFQAGDLGGRGCSKMTLINGAF